MEGGMTRGGEHPAGALPVARPGLLSRYWRLVAVMLPTILAVIYYGGLASNRYVAEAQLVVRTAAKPVTMGGWGALLQMTGLSRSSDDVYAVQSFIGSRDAVVALVDRVKIREIYNRDEADAFSRFPSVIWGSTLDQFHRYLGWMIHTNYSNVTGILTLKVQAFRPEDAKLIADALFALAEETVNRMNRRIREDAVRVSLEEVGKFERRLIDAQVAITRFRNAELMIDAASSSIIVTELVARLSAELARTEAQIREAAAAASGNPALQGLRRRADALQSQIQQERMKIADESGGLAQKLAAYERLVLEREFAKTGLSSAAKELELARTEGRRQQLYLEYVVAPSVPDYPMEPDRMRMIWTVLSLNLVALLVGWLFYAGVRQHSAAG